MTQNTDQPYLSPDGKQFWDGTTWRPNVQAPPVPPFPPSGGFGPPTGAGVRPFGVPGAPVEVDNSFAWALAFAPLLIVLINGVLVSMGAGSVWAFGVLVAIGVNVGLAVADTRRVRAAGHNVPRALAALLVPVYLFLRQGRLRQKYVIPIVWCVSFLFSLGGSGLIANTIGVQIDTGRLERQIQTGVQQQSGQTVTVDCPSSVAARTGASFQCLVTTSNGTRVFATVTVQNSQGDTAWEIK